MDGKNRKIIILKNGETIAQDDKSYKVLKDKPKTNFGNVNKYSGGNKGNHVDCAYDCGKTANCEPKFSDDLGNDELGREKRRLLKTVGNVKRDIAEIERGIEEKEETWWMNSEQQTEEQKKRLRNVEKYYRIGQLKKIADNPYYGRLDVHSNMCDKEIFYIGEREYNSNETPVISVWSEFGKYFRNRKELSFNCGGIDYRVALRRKLYIENGELTDYYDEYNAAADKEKANLTDPFLIKVLERKRKDKELTNIISTLQQKQNEIIDYDFYKNIVVQGCAGSGKTMILLHRLANMKFNLKNYDFTRIKIITPNENFNLFIDGLVENLDIAGITKTTLSGYYIDLILRYEVAINKIGEKKAAERRNYEESLIADEKDVNIEARKHIYSEKFYYYVKGFVRTRTYDTSLKIKDLIGVDKDDKSDKSLMAELLRKYGLFVNYRKNYICILYVKVLILYFFYGKLQFTNNCDTLLCIDEAQDIAPVQFKLIYDVNGEKVKFNIYGDINQQISDNVNIGSWDKILTRFQAKLFSLQENYRNSENIVRYYNEKLGFSDMSFGLNIRNVAEITKQEVRDILDSQLKRENRTAVICLNLLSVYDIINKDTVIGKIEKNKISILNVKQAKGLEFDCVVVFTENMNKNEKYIAFTRALNDLYII